MKNINYDYYSEMVEFLLDEIIDHDSISVIADTELTSDLCEELDKVLYIESEMNSDCDIYLLSRIPDYEDKGDIIYVEPMIRKDKMLSTEDDLIYVQGYLLDLYEDLEDKLEAYEIASVDFDEYDEDEECEENECDCIECTLDKYVEQIQEINGGCPHCIRLVLEDFLGCIVDHIVVED